MQEQSKRKTAAADSHRSRRLIVWISMLMILIFGSLEAVYWVQERSVAREDAERAEKIAADAAKSRDYSTAHSAFQNGHFDAATVHDVVQAEFRRQALARTNGYFDQKTPEQRIAYLDKAIDDMTTYHKAVAMFRPTTKPVKSDGNAQIVKWAVSQPPDTRARLAEFSSALNERCQQRGLPPMTMMAAGAQ
jgi:hypothetical protein